MEAPCPPEELFAWVDDLARYPDWLRLSSSATSAAAVAVTMNDAACVPPSNGNSARACRAPCARVRSGDDLQRRPVHGGQVASAAGAFMGYVGF